MNIGLIGCGNIGKAIIGGIVKSGYMKPDSVIVSDHLKSNLDTVGKLYGVKTTLENREVAEKADILILSVKPNQSEEVIMEIRESVKASVIIVSVMAGKSVNTIMKGFARDIKVVRTMPNAPVLVDEGITAICSSDDVTEYEMKHVVEIFESLGKIEMIEEKQVDVATAITGSSPACVFMFIEAMADAGVAEGLPRYKAYNMAAQAVLGAARMVIETGRHPGELKDMVCSPGGTAIEAVATLEDRGMRSAVIQSMRICTAKSRKMSQE